MKNIIFIIIVLSLFLFTACQKTNLSEQMCSLFDSEGFKTEIKYGNCISDMETSNNTFILSCNTFYETLFFTIKNTNFTLNSMEDLNAIRDCTVSQIN